MKSHFSDLFFLYNSWKICLSKSFRSTHHCISSLTPYQSYSQTLTFSWVFAITFWIITLSHVDLPTLYSQVLFLTPQIFLSQERENDFFHRMLVYFYPIPNILQWFLINLGWNPYSSCMAELMLDLFSLSLICVQCFPMCQVFSFGSLLKWYFGRIVLITCIFLVKCSSLFKFTVNAS